VRIAIARSGDLKMWIECSLLVLAYFLGSLPTGYIAGRMVGIDIRSHGSGSTGATNVWRTIGKYAGITVFIIDLTKGLTAVLLMKFFGNNDTELLPYFTVGAAMMALLGHTRSLWLGFKGGKAVASGLGVLLALNWLVALGAFGLWLVTMAIWRTVSISSICAAIAAPILMVATQSNPIYTIFASVAGSYVVWLHRSNIQRLREGTEPSLLRSSSK
jgi:acyl phosphate:glycerol-3-phosphate acyltransferase